MSDTPPRKRLPESGSISGVPWPDQIWIDQATGEKEIRSPLQDKYIYGNPEWPIAPFRDALIDTVSNNMVTVLASGTGNGKSIFVPQALYESGRFRRVFITQPRIVATRENTEYIKYQMEQATGSDMSHVVAYRTATEGDDIKDSHRIRQHTDGYTLQQMMGAGNDVITNEDIIIIDEAHERNPNIDIAIALALEKKMRLLIQSATIDTDRVATYCSQVLGGVDVPVMEIPGVMHEVEELQGGELHEEIIKYANLDPENPMNIMALIPGRHETEEMFSRISKRIPKSYTLLALHGDQTIAEQRRAMQSYPGGKIILSTDIGRQSITISDLHVVLDGMYHKLGDYRRGVRYLRVAPISRTAVVQGKGRVGRTMPGTYRQTQLPGYPLIPRDAEGKLMIDSFEVPPIQRTDPAPYMLKLAQAGLSLGQLNLPDRIRTDELEYAHHKLVRLGAQVLNSDYVTEVGTEMQKLPLDPTYARMLIEARRYGKNIELQMAAMVSACQQDGVTMTERQAEQWRNLTKETHSDMLVQLDILAQALWMSDEEMKRFNIVDQRVVRAKRLLERLCHDANLNMWDLKTPTPVERQKLIGCIIAGCDTLFVNRGQNYSNEDGFEGRLAKSTSVRTNATYVIGTPLVLEHYRNKRLKTHNIIVNATAVTAEQLQQYAPWRCDYDNEQLIVDKKGKVLQSRNVYFDGKALYETSYQDVEASHETTKALLDTLFHNPDIIEDASEKTQDIYKEVARLRDLLVDRSENADYFEGILHMLVDNAGRWKDVKVKNMYALANVLHKRQVHTWLKMMLSEESHEAKDILQKSPDSIVVDINNEPYEAKVTYQHNKAFIDIPLPHAKFLQGGVESLGDRHIYVWSDSTHRNYLTLHKAIEKSLAGNRAERRATQKAERASSRTTPR